MSRCRRARRPRQLLQRRRAADTRAQRLPPNQYANPWNAESHYLGTGTEICDDGNRIGGDGCNATCDSQETCGNNTVDWTAGELCDEGAGNSDTLGRLPAVEILRRTKTEVAKDLPRSTEQVLHPEKYIGKDVDEPTVFAGGDPTKALGGGWQVRFESELFDAETREALSERSDWGDLIESTESAVSGKKQ